MSDWQMPSLDTTEDTPEWTLEADAGPLPVVRTGPSGLLLGEGAAGPVSIRLFRRQPTRILLAVPEYVTWLLAFRAMSLGAHLSIFAEDPHRWQGLVDVVVNCGGTADILGPGQSPPGAGRPYRPSLIVDDVAWYDGVQASIGPWQAVLSTEDASQSAAVGQLRSCDLALVAPVAGRTADHLRRAYAVSAQQIKTAQGLQDNEVALAMPRRLLRLAIPPTPTEYQLLFGGM